MGDFCVPSEPGASAAHASEQAISEQAANSAGLLQTKAAAAAAAAEQAISEQTAAPAAAATPSGVAAASAAAEPVTASACMHPSWILAGYMARQMWIPCTHDARRHSVQRLGLAF